MEHLITYTAKRIYQNTIESGQLVVKNSDNVLDAEVKLKRYLTNRHPIFKSVQIHDCIRYKKPFFSKQKPFIR